MIGCSSGLKCDLCVTHIVFACCDSYCLRLRGVVHIISDSGSDLYCSGLQCVTVVGLN